MCFCKQHENPLTHIYRECTENSTHSGISMEEVMQTIGAARVAAGEYADGLFTHTATIWVRKQRMKRQLTCVCVQTPADTQGNAQPSSRLCSCTHTRCVCVQASGRITRTDSIALMFPLGAYVLTKKCVWEGSRGTPL